MSVKCIINWFSSQRTDCSIDSYCKTLTWEVHRRFTSFNDSSWEGATALSVPSSHGKATLRTTRPSTLWWQKPFAIIVTWMTWCPQHLQSTLLSKHKSRLQNWVARQVFTYENWCQIKPKFWKTYQQTLQTKSCKPVSEESKLYLTQDHLRPSVMILTMNQSWRQTTSSFVRWVET